MTNAIHKSAHHPGARIAGLWALLICLVTSTPALASCSAFAALEPLYHNYTELLKPRTDRHATQAARKLRLEIQNDSGATYLRKLGLRPDHRRFSDLSQAIDAMAEMIDLRLRGETGSRKVRRSHLKNREQMHKTLMRTECFDNGLARKGDVEGAPLVLDLSDGPARDLTLGQFTAQAFETLVREPPVWLLWLYVLGPIAAVGGFFLYRLSRRYFERRGYPRQIYTGQLTLETDRGEFLVRAADIGRSGAKVRASDGLRDARDVFLAFDDTRVPVHLTWENAHFAGVHFRNPISRSQLRTILQAT